LLYYYFLLIEGFQNVRITFSGSYHYLCCIACDLTCDRRQSQAAHRSRETRAGSKAA
jgi:hypothetical protein